jgi:hypothetical protein
MLRMMPVLAFAAATAFAADALAQDTTIKSRTEIDADDAKVMTMTGCLQTGPSGDVFVLSNATVTKGEEIESRSRVEADVDDDETEVETRARTEVDRDDDDDEDKERAVGTSGRSATYELTPRAGVDLKPHVGHRVEISAIALDAKDGDDDAEIEIEQEIETDVDDAPDSRVKSETEAELPRGEKARIVAVAVKHISGSCGQ